MGQMKITSLLKILGGANQIAGNIAQDALQKGHTIIDDHLLKGKYVTREEFDNLMQMVLKLRAELDTQKSKNST